MLPEGIMGTVIIGLMSKMVWDWLKIRKNGNGNVKCNALSKDDLKAAVKDTVKEVVEDDFSKLKESNVKQETLLEQIIKK